MNETETRAHVGQLLRRDGTSMPVKFVPTGDPDDFIVVNRAGDRVRRLYPGDQLRGGDDLGPSRRILIDGVNTWAAS